MTQPVVIGVDLGTTGCKADAFSLSGELARPWDDFLYCSQAVPQLGRTGLLAVLG